MAAALAPTTLISSQPAKAVPRSVVVLEENKPPSINPILGGGKSSGDVNKFAEPASLIATVIVLSALAIGPLFEDQLEAAAKAKKAEANAACVPGKIVRGKRVVCD